MLTARQTFPMKPTTPEEVRNRVVQALRDVLGDECADVELTDEIKPIGKLGLDSLDGLDYACELSSALDFDLPKKENPLVDDARQRARSIGEIVKFVCGKMNIKEASVHAS